MLVSAKWLRSAVAAVLLSALCSAGCSNSTALSTPAKSAPAKPQVVVLTLEGQAARVDRRQIVFTLTDTSGEGAKVIDVSTVGLDRLTDKDGQTVPALLNSFYWSKKAAEQTGADGGGSGGQEVFQLQLLLDTRFAQPVANLEGSFRTFAGNPTSLNFPLKDIQNGEISDPKLKALSITATTSVSHKIDLVLQGADTAQIADAELVSGSEVVRQVARATSAKGSSVRQTWQWRSDSELAKDYQLKVWLRSADRQGEPSWVLKPNQLPDNKVRHESLDMAGEIRTHRVLNAQIKGQPTKLLEAKFVDGDTTPEQGKPNVSMTYDRTINVSITAPTPSTALQIRFAEDGYENMQVFKIENVVIEKAR